MKNLILVIICAAFFNLNACGQTNKDVPENVKNAFTQKFPKATKVKWSKENDKEWEAEFKMDGKEYSANFDNNGVWIETESEINSKDIPSVVKSTLDKEFAGYKVSESEVSETADGKAYEFELKKDGKKAEVSIDVSGKVLEQEQGEEGDEDDKD
jgi:hypothetical protein